MSVPSRATLDRVVVMQHAPTRRVSALHGLWVLVFAVEALVKNADPAHLLGAIALGLLFAVLVATELRSLGRRPFAGQAGERAGGLAGVGSAGDG